METKALLAIIINHLEDIKALDIVEIDLIGASSITDYIVICTATSTAHAKGIHDRLHLNVKNLGLYPIGVEGYQAGDWILMDYNDIIIHIFTEECREAYNLEDLHEKAEKRRIQ